MMAAANCIAISGRKYCIPKSTNLKIDAENGVAYADNALLFKVEEDSISLHNRHALRDAAGYPIFTLHNKIVTLHDRWEVFKGDGILSHNLLFTVKRKTMIQWGEIDLEVFLANNKAESDCDFTLSASLLKRTCNVFSGQSSTAIAKIKKIKGGNFEATVNPNTDLAFIATLMIILNKTKHFDGVTSTTFQVARMMVDPFDASGLLFNALGEPILDSIMDFAVEQITENVTN